MKPYNPFQLRDILAYDSLVHNQLTTIERIHIHQHIAQHVPFTARLHKKIEHIHEIIKATQWKAPEVRYKEYSPAKMAIETYNENTEQWEPHKT